MFGIEMTLRFAPWNQRPHRHKGVAVKSFLKCAQRDRFKDVAEALKVPFVILACWASIAILRARSRARTPRAHPSAAIALAHTALCAIPFTEIDKLCASEPTLRQPLWRTLSQVTEDSQAHAMLPADKPAEQRIATFLMQLFDRKQTAGLAAEVLELSMARADIANFLGLATETVSRWFTRLQQFNLIFANGSHIAI
jgi:CRP-like cAMP-binding protein